MEAKIKLKQDDAKVKVKASSLQGALGKLARLGKKLNEQGSEQSGSDQGE